MPRPKALLIAAPGIFRDQLAAQLAGAEGSETTAAGSLAEARAAIGESLFAFAVIDERLEQEDGAAVARALEEDGFSAPGLLLGAGERGRCPGRADATVQAVPHYRPGAGAGPAFGASRRRCALPHRAI